MGKQRATFGKLQRERDKKAKAAAKRERRTARGDGSESVEPSDEVAPDQDQGALLDALAALHRSYEDGVLSDDQFEARREDLRSRLRID